MSRILSASGPCEGLVANDTQKYGIEVRALHRTQVVVIID